VKNKRGGGDKGRKEREGGGEYIKNNEGRKEEEGDD